MIKSQLNIKLGQFIKEELNEVLTKFKAEKLQVLMKYSQKYGRQENLMISFFDFAMLYINKIEKWIKDCIFSFSKKDDLRITKNYRGLTSTFTAAKVYNALLLKHMKLESEKTLRKNQNGF